MNSPLKLDNAVQRGGSSAKSICSVVFENVPLLLLFFCPLMFKLMLSKAAA